MVCPRCLWAVEKSLSELGIKLLKLELGHAVIEPIDLGEYEQIMTSLNNLGFELLHNSDGRLIEIIKLSCRKYLEKTENNTVKILLSEYIAQIAGKNYNYLTRLFSSHEGQTIESYYMELRMDRVKQLLEFREYTLSQIAVKLNYSSVFYLSSQFKKMQGCTVTDYMKDRETA